MRNRFIANTKIEFAQIYLFERFSRPFNQYSNCTDFLDIRNY